MARFERLKSRALHEKSHEQWLGMEGGSVGENNGAIGT